jgi:hypothetical protein
MRMPFLGVMVLCATTACGPSKFQSGKVLDEAMRAKRTAA